MLEGRKGVVYAGYGMFVGLDVKVGNCVLDQLWKVVSLELSF